MQNVTESRNEACIPAFKSSRSVSQFIIFSDAPFFTLYVSVIILVLSDLILPWLWWHHSLYYAKWHCYLFSLVPAVKRKYVLSTLIKHVIFRPSAERHLTQNAIRALSGLLRHQQVVHRVIVNFIHSLHLRNLKVYTVDIKYRWILHKGTVLLKNTRLICLWVFPAVISGAWHSSSTDHVNVIYCLF